MSLLTELGVVLVLRPRAPRGAAGRVPCGSGQPPPRSPSAVFLVRESRLFGFVPLSAIETGTSSARSRLRVGHRGGEAGSSTIAA